MFPVQFDQAAQVIVGRLALGLVPLKHRELNDEEWHMAERVFGGQLPPRKNIRLANLGVPRDPELIRSSLIGLSFSPAIANQYYVNLGPNYSRKIEHKEGTAPIARANTHVAGP